MRSVISLTLLILFFGSESWAINCKLAQFFNHPSLANNAEFWQKLGTINAADDRAVEALIRQFGPDALSAASTQSTRAVATNSKEVFRLKSKAEKAKDKLSKINKRHFDEFIQVVTDEGTNVLYSRPKRWHYEKLQSNKNQHTVRLDDGVRVLFEIGDDGVLNILDMGSHVTH